MNRALVDTKPTDKTYLQPGVTTVGIAEGNPGHGMRFFLTQSGDWQVQSQFEIPLLDDDPLQAEMDPILTGDGLSADAPYYYRKLVDGVAKRFKIVVGGTITEVPSNQNIVTTELRPWQDLLGHIKIEGGEATRPGRLLELDEVVKTKVAIPDVPWTIQIDSDMATFPTSPATPFWLGEVGTGLEITLIENETDREIIKLTVTRQGSKPAGDLLDLRNKWISQYSSANFFWIAESIGTVSVEVEGVSKGDYWIDGIVNLLPDDTSVKPFRIPITLWHYPGMIGIQATRMWLKDGDQLAEPPDITMTSSRTWAIEEFNEARVEIKAVGDPSILVLGINAQYQRGLSTEFGPTPPPEPEEGEEPIEPEASVGYRLTVARRPNCFVTNVCPVVFPHGHQEWRLDSISCGDLEFGDIEMASYTGCEILLNGQYWHKQQADAYNEIGEVRLVINDFVSASGPGSYVETGTLTQPDPSYTFTTPAETDAASLRVVVSSDPDDEQYVYVIVTVEVQAWGASVLEGEFEVWFHEYATSELLSFWHDGDIEYVSRRMTIADARQLNMIFGPIERATWVYRKHVPRWKGLQGPELDFSFADFVNGVEFDATSPKQIATTASVTYSTYTRQSVPGDGPLHIEGFTSIWIFLVINASMSGIRHWRVEDMAFTIAPRIEDEE